MFKYLAVLGLLCICVDAQQPRHNAPQSPKPLVSLELGSVTVWLGMTQTEALLKLQRAGYHVEGDSAMRIVNDGEKVYTIEFENGQLTFADREWHSQGTNVMDAVLGALTALASYGPASCAVTHAPITQPDYASDRIFIECGKRSVLLSQGHFGSVSTVSADERIGQLE